MQKEIDDIIEYYKSFVSGFFISRFSPDLLAQQPPHRDEKPGGLQHMFTEAPESGRHVGAEGAPG